MFLIRQIKVKNLEENIEDVNGIEFTDFSEGIQHCSVSSGIFLFSPKIKANIGAEFEDADEAYTYKATYANSYEINEEEYGRELVLNVGAKEEKIDGYIIFIEYLYDAKTDGKIIEGNLNAMAILLEEGNYIEFTLEEKGKKIIKMVDGKLFMSM